MKVAGVAAALTRWANPEDRLKLISLMPRPDLVMQTETREVTVKQGSTAEIAVAIARQPGSTAC